MLKTPFSSFINKIFQNNSSRYIEKVKSGVIPTHIAIIMDGNGRWAKRKGLPRTYGHKAGIDTIKNVVKWSDDFGIKILTLYAFSTENWHRPKSEVDFLMKLPVEFLEKELESLMKNNIKLNVLGEAKDLPEKTQSAVFHATKKTANNSGLILNLAFNYGSRAEIIRAVSLICEKAISGKIKVEDINEDLFENFLFTQGIPDPELLIRPSGEFRLSNFLLWQLAYSEFWFSKTMWPDFSKEEFVQALLDFQQRDRRFGGIKL